VVRRAFSDPRVPHESTGVEGRGTEEVKTNDISGRVKTGEVGFTIEFGRPGVGVWMREIQDMAWTLAKAGVAFEKRNPITSLMTDVNTGTLRTDILNEKVMSAHSRDQVPVSRTEEIIRLVWDVEKRIDTVVALGVAPAVTRRAMKRLWRRCWSASATSSSAPRLTWGWDESRILRPGSPDGDSSAMTNTLHRFGDAESFRDDYVVFAIACRGKNDEGSVPKLRKFLELALKHKPVNLGDARHGGALRSSRNLNPLSHWNRDDKPDFQAVIDGLDTTTTAAAVFDNLEAAEALTRDVRDADLGLSVNISTSITGAEACCHAAGIPRHSAGYSLGFEGKTEHLPNSDVLKISTMCGMAW
jgi:hypothetical protein